METMQLFYDNLVGIKVQRPEPGHTPFSDAAQNEDEPDTAGIYMQYLAHLTHSRLDQLIALKTLLGWRPWG